MATPRFVVVANPGSLRQQAFERSLEAFWRARGQAHELDILPWALASTHAGNLADLSVFDRPAVVRLESPGRDWDVARLFLQRGARMVGDSSGTDWLSLPFRTGWLGRPSLFYAGFCQVLERLEQAFASHTHLHLLNHPAEVVEMFDKNATCRRLHAALLPVPAWFDAPTTPEELLAELQVRRFATAYVKLNTGSSASAIAVVRPLEHPVRALTSVALIDGDFYSTRRLRSYYGEDLRCVLRFLLREGVCVQQGIRMAQINATNFDVRVILIAGQPRFVIFRLSHQPMTNLHLGGQRGDPAECRAAIPPRAWLDALDHCREAAGLYRSSMVGIDLLFEQGYLRHYLLEVNAFGDFFPNLTDENGIDVHTAEIEVAARQMGWCD